MSIGRVCLTQLSKVSVFAAVAVLTVATPAFSQTAPVLQLEPVPRVEITPFLGFAANMGSMMRYGGNEGPFSVHGGTGPGFGGRVAFQVGDRLFIEPAVGYSRVNHMADGMDGTGHMSGYPVVSGANARPANSLSYEANALYEFRSSRWAPYLTAGAGAVTTWLDGGGTWTDPAANVGVGLKFYVQPRVALRLDMREYVGSFHEINTVASTTAVGPSSFGAHPQFTIGMGFGF